ncbi:hypothetical protein BDP27DRAFT_1314669 [Rhodocollybia butyracea]|uniref:Protein bir1 n=1 Tax=Rhodocollybia butyracea TaxID=206335 RepID=A0A9P5UD62_9AGAR|nr:hypothetical protein BDP27DRAFT_1314669 [Rhodocollybia butyracea]
MDILQNRLESFTRPKRTKGAPKSLQNQKWPHPAYFMATPMTLAEAGFYFDPSSEDKDAVTCYMCQKQLGEWAEKDNPFQIHFDKCGKKCAWASLRCGLGNEMNLDGQFVFTDKNRLPTSKPMEKARLDTFLFGDGWIHDQTKNHGLQNHDDTAVCLYCGISLSGWDEDDDPTEEHRKRVKKAGNPCPMFPDIVFAPPKTHSRSKSKSSHVDVTMPMKTYDGSDDGAATSDTIGMGSVATTSAAKTPRASRTVKKGARTPAQSSLKPRAIPVGGGDDDDVMIEVLAPRKASTTTRSRSVSRTRSVASGVDSDVGTGTEDEVPTRSTNTRSRGKSKDSGMGADESSAAKKKGNKTRSKSKTRVSVIPENLSAEDEKPAPLPPKSTRKTPARKASTRKLTTAKSTSSLTQKHNEMDTNEEDEPVHVPHAKKTAAKSKPMTASVAAAVSPFTEDDAGDEIERVEDRVEVDELAARPTRATRKSTKPVPRPRTQMEPRTSNTGRKDTHSRTASTASTASTRGGKSRVPSPPQENADDEDPLEYMLMHVPPASTSSVEPEPEVLLTARKPDKPKSKSAKKASPSPILADFPEPNGRPPPVPPRSPSRPRSKPKPSPESEPERIDSEDAKPAPEAKTETFIRTALSDSRLQSRVPSTDEQSTRPNPPPKAATMSRKGSFLNSRSSVQRRAGTASVDKVWTISSDEDDEDEISSQLLKPPSQTESKSPEVKLEVDDTIKPVEPAETNILKPDSKSDSTPQSRPTSTIFKEGSVQAKVAQIEKTVGVEIGTDIHFDTEMQKGGDRESEAVFEITETQNDEDRGPARRSEVHKNEAHDVQMARPLDLFEESVDTNPMYAFPQPAVTPPRAQQHSRPASPFKTPFRMGTGPGNPFSIPPTPGAPLNIPLGVPIPLSNELFVPTQDLSEAELSMTVEEWVRYHMQIEYVKFKEDGEREIAAFTRKAEQARKTIDAL